MAQPDPLAQLLSRRPQRLTLLEQIAVQGSITRAAKAAGLSYKAAWDAIDELNNLAEQPLVSRSVGGSGGSGGMTRVATTRATSAIGGIGRPGADRPLSGDSVANSRTDEEIQIVFDRYKSALYRLYNRELRKDPTLRGQMVLKLTIEPDGSVSMCQLEATDMNAPELGVQVVERVKTINFGAKDVAALTILYPIDFLPAA